MSKMKKILPKEVVHDDEEVGAPADRHSAIYDAARRQHEEDLRKALAKRINSTQKASKHRTGNSGIDHIGGGVHSVDESIMDYMDSVLSEKLFELMEASSQPQDPAEQGKPIVKPDVAPTGNTPVFTAGSGTGPGMTRSDYQKAQGVVGISKGR